MQLQELTRRKPDGQREVLPTAAFLTNTGREATVYNEVISFPVTTIIAGNDFCGGLLHSDTFQLIEKAVLLRSGKLSQTMPVATEKIAVSSLRKMEGHFLYGGLLLNNFGHFLLESLGRLWAYHLCKSFNPYILFYAPWGIPDYRRSKHFVNQLFKGFGIPVERIIFLTEMVQFKNVIVPEQKYGYGMCRTPDSTFLQFVRSFKPGNQLFGRKSTADKVYVSRSQLPFGQGRPLGETLFENYLQANGYVVIYPEQLTIYEQVAIYSNAKKIVFCDGGAMYSCILLPDIRADIAIVARRRDHRWNYKEVTEFFLGYNKSILWIDEVTGQYQFGLETWDAAAEVDWYKVSVTLQEQGFVTSIFEVTNAEDYRNTIRRELLQYVQSIQSNPLFLDYMQTMKATYDILPASF
jgi:hypothetical protein